MCLEHHLAQTASEFVKETESDNDTFSCFKASIPPATHREESELASLALRALGNWPPLLFSKPASQCRFTPRFMTQLFHTSASWHMLFPSSGMLSPALSTCPFPGDLLGTTLSFAFPPQFLACSGRGNCLPPCGDWARPLF